MSAAAKGLIDRIIDAGLSPPQKVTIAITNGCNLSCAHCWPDSLVSGIKHPVPLDVVAKLIGELAELGVEGLCITGGEPLAHPAWSEILHLCCTSFRFKEVCLQTNATLLTEDKISVLNSPALKPLVVQVSLDGAISATHAAVRGQGSFERTFHALQMLASAGLGGRTRVAFTEMEHNFDELPRLLGIMEAMGIGQVVSSTLIRGGRAAQTHRLIPPRSSQYEGLVGRYLSDKRFRDTYERIGKIAAIEWYKGMPHDTACGCTFLSQPYVTADGRMFPCAMLQADEFTLHGVHERPLADAFPEVLPVWAELLAMSRRRLVELNSCRECAGRQHCAGGCMGRALMACGDAMTVEDRCSLRKTVYQFSRKIACPA